MPQVTLPGGETLPLEIDNEKAQRLARAVVGRLVDVRRRIDQGKGTWPNPNYIRDSVWDGWLQEQISLQTILYAAGLDWAALVALAANVKQ